VTILFAGLVLVGFAVVAVALMLLARRRAPAGGYFENGDRTAGVFGVLATGFAVLLGFVVFLAFQSFDASRSGGEEEARVVAQQFVTAQFLPPAAGARLSGELICYARDVVHVEWPAMQSGSLADAPNPWAVEMFRTLKTVEPASASEQAAYAKWLDQSTDRESARGDRIHGAEGVIPSPLWAVLFLSAAILFLFMLMFADSAERAIAQAAMMGSVVVVIASTLLLLFFLNNPYRGGSGSLRPVAMQRTLTFFTQAMAAVGTRIPAPCDGRGTLPR
jgi:hypothetical protein